MNASRVLVGGRCRGVLLALTEPLSLWGGVNPATGMIVEEGHPQAGQSLENRILAMPHGRGSSSSSSVLAELLRTGLGPAGIILGSPDSILVVGSLVAQRLYATSCPVIVVSGPISGEGMWEIDGDRFGPMNGVEKEGDNADNH